MQRIPYRCLPVTLTHTHCTPRPPSAKLRSIQGRLYLPPLVLRYYHRPELLLRHHRESPSPLLLSHHQMKYIKPLHLVHEMMKSRTVERGRLLGLDVGDRYIGLAGSDFDYKIASPLRVLVRKGDNIDVMATDFQNLISKLPISAFIFGYPFDKLKNSPNAVQVKLFIDALCETKKLKGVTYTFWNECLTSKTEELFLKHLNLHPVESKTIRDKFAAVSILQGYLDFANRNMESRSSDIK